MFLPWVGKFLGGQHFQISANSFTGHVRLDDVIYESCEQQKLIGQLKTARDHLKL